MPVFVVLVYLLFDFQAYNKEYAETLEQCFSTSINNLPLLITPKDSAVKLSPFVCPSCGFRIESRPTVNGGRQTGGNQDLNDNVSEDGDSDFVMRQSNVTFPPLLSMDADDADGESLSTVVELSPASLRLFGEAGCCLVPPHLYSALASHEAGFRLLCRSGELLVSSTSFSS